MEERKAHLNHENSPTSAPVDAGSDVLRKRPTESNLASRFISSVPPSCRHVFPLEKFCFASEVVQSSTGSPFCCSPLQLRCALK